MSGSVETVATRWATWQEKGRRQDAGLQQQSWWFLGLAAIGVGALLIRVLA